MGALDRTILALPRERADALALILTVAALALLLGLLLRVARALPPADAPDRPDDAP